MPYLAPISDVSAAAEVAARAAKKRLSQSPYRDTAW
jgi:hypothetical protein